MSIPTKTPTADALRGKIIHCGDWPKLAQHVAGAIDSVAGLERHNAHLQARIIELERAAQAAKRAA